MQASLDPMVEVPMVLAGSGECHNSASMCTQRISSSAVCGYSSLSIMFLSNVSDIRLLGFRLHPGAAERGQIEARAAVEDQLVVDQMVGGAGRHAFLGNGVAGRRPQQPLPRVHGAHHACQLVSPLRIMGYSIMGCSIVDAGIVAHVLTSPPAARRPYRFSRTCCAGSKS